MLFSNLTYPAKRDAPNSRLIPLVKDYRTKNDDRRKLYRPPIYKTPPLTQPARKFNMRMINL